MRSAAKMICRLLVVSLMMFQFSAAHASMVRTDQVIAGAQAERNTVLSTLNRAEVASQLQAMGVDPAQAQERVAALTDDEARSLAGNLNSAPAGAMFPGGWWVIGIIVALVVYFTWKPRAQ